MLHIAPLIGTAILSSRAKLESTWELGASSSRPTNARYWSWCKLSNEVDDQKQVTALLLGTNRAMETSTPR